MKTIFKTAMLLIFATFVTTSFAQEVKVVSVNSNDTIVSKVRVSKIDGSKMTEAEMQKFLSDVKVVQFGKDSLNNPEILVRKMDGGRLTAKEENEIRSDVTVVKYGSQIKLVTAQQAYDATQKSGAKGKLVYFGKDADNKLNGVNFIKQESSDNFAPLGENVKNVTEIYLLSQSEKDAKGLVFFLSRSNNFQDKKIYVVQGGLEAWMKL